MTDPVLYGHDDETNIVAVQTNGDNMVRLYKRAGDIIEHRDETFYPFFHLSDKRFLDGFPQKAWVKKLEGSNHYQYLCAFPSVPVFWDAVQYALRSINREYKTGYNSYTETDHLFLRPDMNTQYLLQSGKTLFKGMRFDDLHRLQLDIETYSKDHRFSRADRSTDRIILISLSDNRGWETVLGGKGVPEKRLLQQCVKAVRERDPDIIEGHNIFNFDLPYILKRCEMHGVEFAVGRDGSPPSVFRTRTSFTENAVEYLSYESAGRHIVDTWLLVQSFDMNKRNMESHGLKYAASYFGVAAPDRTYIDGDRISWHWDNDVETLKRYALDDVRETRGLSSKLSGSNFHLTQMLPYNYGTVSKLGSAAKIEAVFLREYIRQRHSVPKPQAGIPISGGYTDMFATGVFGPIIHADVESLYPSIMLSKGVRPITDDLGIFRTALRYLTDLRLEAKRSLPDAPAEERTTIDALQSSYKILINSFYGYLGYSKGLFNDYGQADLVTTTGQALLKSLIREIERHNGTVIEVDTDGLYFIPPDNVVGEEAERRFVEHLSGTLPEGIRLAFGGRFTKMLSYKKKNYALLHPDDRITIRGSSLVARSIERFGRQYLQHCIERLLSGDMQQLHDLYIGMEHTIRSHSWDVQDFLRSETLKDAPEAYAADVAAGRRNRSAAYELALRSSRSYRQGSRLRYYITGSDANVRGFENAKEAHEWDANFPDENTAYYLKRLNEFSEKFSEFFTESDFRAVFSTEDLFGFTPSAIMVVNRRVEPEREAGPAPGESYTIELDSDDA